MRPKRVVLVVGTEAEVQIWRFRLTTCCRSIHVVGAINLAEADDLLTAHPQCEDALLFFGVDSAALEIWLEGVQDRRVLRVLAVCERESPCGAVVEAAVSARDPALVAEVISGVKGLIARKRWTGKYAAMRAYAMREGGIDVRPCRNLPLPAGLTR